MLIVSVSHSLENECSGKSSYSDDNEFQFLTPLMCNITLNIFSFKTEQEL